MKKVGIITVHQNTNYGANLQAFASTAYVNRLGYDAKLVDYAMPSNYKTTRLLGWLGATWRNDQNKSLVHRAKLFVSLAVSAPWKAKRLRRFAAFRKNLIPMTKRCRIEAEIARLGLDAVVVGSDQIWCPEITEGLRPAYFGKIDGVATRVSYAASVGGAEFNAEEERVIADYVKGIDHCSVREQGTADYIGKVSGRDVAVVCDPVFLLDKADYQKIEKNAHIKGDYVLMYSIVGSEKMTRIATEYARKHGLKLVEICTGETGAAHTQISGLGPREFLNAFNGAKVVFTNSFHGTAFSIIYEKNFFAVNNEHGGTRITNLLQKTGLTGRLISDEQGFEQGAIDYQLARPHIDAYVSASRQFLQQALNGEQATVAGKSCTGCGACAAVCHKNAICMTTDVEGFFSAQINKSLCTDCGLCQRVCPALNKSDFCSCDSAIAFKATSVDRATVASGGAFSAMAQKVIKQGGAVYGAVLTSSGTVRHERVESTDGLEKLKGTKYVQSDVRACYFDIENDLKSGKTVLFAGTPCQVDGVKSYFARNKTGDKLITADIVCHGVPSPAFFAQYLAWLEQKLGDKVAKYCFRSKKISWRGDSAMAITAKGKELVGDKRVRAYMNTYYSGVMTRESCFACKYTCTARVGDITIADFWGIEDAAPQMEDALGVSMVLTNTARGKQFFDGIDGQKVEVSLGFAKQPQLSTPARRPVERDDARQLFASCGAAPVLKKFGGLNRPVGAIIKSKIKRILGK